MFTKLNTLTALYQAKVAAVCKGPMGLGQSCEPANKAKALQIAQKYKDTLPIFNDWSKTFSTSPVSRVINAVLDGDPISPADIAGAAAMIGRGDYQGVNAQEWQDMIDHYAPSITE